MPHRARRKKKHQPKARNHAAAKTPEAKREIKVASIMTAIDYCFGIGFAVTLTGTFACYQMDKPRATVYWGLACWIFAGAGLAAVKLNSLSKSDKAIQSDRAWLVVTTVDFAHLTDEGQFPTAEVVVANVGKTLALNVTPLSNIGKGVLDPSKPMPIGTPLHEPSKAVIGPGHDLIVPITHEKPQTADIIAGFKSGAVGIYTFGVINYDDTDGNPWHTEYCFKADPKDTKATVCPFWNAVGAGYRGKNDHQK